MSDDYLFISQSGYLCTKQGVRDLNSKQTNKRRPISEEQRLCLHDWKHHRYCMACDLMYSMDPGPCTYVCTKCDLSSSR